MSLPDNCELCVATLYVTSVLLVVPLLIRSISRIFRQPRYRSPKYQILPGKIGRISGEITETLRETVPKEGWFRNVLEFLICVVSGFIHLLLYLESSHILVQFLHNV